MCAQGLKSRIVHDQSLVTQVSRAHDLDVPVLDHAFSALAGDRLELVDRPGLRRVPDDPLSNRMFGMGFDRGGIGDDLVFGKRRVEHECIGDPELALGQRPGLVEDDRVDLARLFKRGPVADEQAIGRCNSG